MADTAAKAYKILHHEVLLGESVVTPEGGQRPVIVLAVDGSPQAEHAFQWYLKHLHRKENFVCVVHALEIPVFPTGELNVSMAWEIQLATGNRVKAEMVEKFAAKFKEFGMTGKFVAEFQRAGELIVEQAVKDGATYVVVGTRGMGMIRRTIMGSVSDYVVHHAHCPVVVTRT